MAVANHLRGCVEQREDVEKPTIGTLLLPKNNVAAPSAAGAVRKETLAVGVCAMDVKAS